MKRLKNLGLAALVCVPAMISVEAAGRSMFQNSDYYVQLKQPTTIGYGILTGLLLAGYATVKCRSKDATKD